MFAKLLKHEWRATRSIIGLLCVIILISGLTIGGVMHYMMWAEQSGALVVVNEMEQASTSMSDFASVMCGLLIMAGVIAIAVCCSGSVFFVIYRFYKSRFTDEGYLTFTLPVTNHQQLLASIVNSIIGVAIVILTAFVAILIAGALFLTAFPENLIWANVEIAVNDFFQMTREFLAEHGKDVAVFALSVIISLISELIVLMLAVTIGSLIAKKHKILAAVAVYYGIGIAKSFVNLLVGLGWEIESTMTFLSFPGLTGLVIAVGGYFLMHYLTSRKLNLA